ncbi:MAG TPA: tRNA (adenosine(37)-N6)-threonylcarbamoyltransferase complex ATPase subunit type 1 TsaE, partial [Beijerinckiaceae bacterium]|nr:tRNA (adenosine(37)-N6)-threonylcarbamoyltransferase complex ATPase subunit type 1 TsaE [Beijerinckiaceae bacterium]
DLAATTSLAAFIAAQVQPGDLVTLSGDLGAGKTALARAIVRVLAMDPELEVPSPTFTLMQTYESRRGPIVHADFYRIAGPGELIELGWDEVADTSILLVEWPERAAAALNPARLDVHLELAPADGPDMRIATLRASGSLASRFAQARALRGLLYDAGWADGRRIAMQGDASTRAYERLVKPSGETAVLMISPPRPDGPPVRRGKPYSAIARLAESVHAFVAMDKGLRALGFSAPHIYGEDLGAGLLVIEDLGNEPVVGPDGPIPERYAEATRLLARLHGTMLPNILPVAEGHDHVLPPYDLDALLIEVELLVDWYCPHVAGLDPSGSVRGEFVNLWREAVAEILRGPTTWTLRDYHSPNLLWLPSRSGVARVGLLDFQDAVLGHPAYDLVSLLQDARVTVPPDLEIKLLGLYARERQTADAAFDMSAFARAYAILGAQRATKILGIFARLDRRDGKPHYLAHLPRIETYLARNLAHGAVAKLRTWYDTHLPRLAGNA